MRPIAKKVLPDVVETAVLGPTPAQRQAGITQAGAQQKILQGGIFAENMPVTGAPPATEGGIAQPEQISVPSQVSLDVPKTTTYNIEGGIQLPQQPVMMGSPMVYGRVAQTAAELARRGGLTLPGLAVGTGIGAIADAVFGPDGKALTIPQQMRAATGMAFTRKTQMAYKDLVEMTGLENAAACTGVPVGLLCKALIHKFPVRRRGITAAQLRTAKRVNGTIARMRKELSTEFKTSTRRASTRRSNTIIAQN